MSKVLNWATCAGKTAVVLAILKTGNVDVNKQVEDQTPLFAAAYNSDLKVMKKLVEMGADPKIDSAWSSSSEYFSSSSALHAFVANCRITFPEASIDASIMEGLNMLLQMGCDVNQVDGLNRTVLHYAVAFQDRYTSQYCSPEIIEILLKHGADASNSCRPLHVISRGSEKVIQLLLSHGADINARDPRDGRTPIFHTLSDFSDEDFMLLVNHGADCTTQDSNGDTPLHIVLAENYPSILKVKTLLENGANANAKNSAGDIPLHVMESFSNKHEILDLLIAGGVDLEAKTRAGLTVLMRALKSVNYRTLLGVERLLALGARIDTVDFEGRTVLHTL